MTVRQAIETKYLPPTNHHGGRVQAKCQAGMVVRPWDYALSAEDNHKQAAWALIVKLGWDGASHPHDTWYGGCPTASNPAAYIFVQATEGSRL